MSRLKVLGVGGWLRSLAYVGRCAAGAAKPQRGSDAGVPLPRFSRLLGPAAERARDPLARLAGALMIATMLLAILAALGLVFDPRYRDFPFAPLTAAAVPFFMRSVTMPRPAGRRGASEWAAAGMLALVDTLHRAQ